MVVFGAFLAVSASPARAELPEDVVRWAEKVVLGPEYGGDGKICARWVKNPTVSIMTGTDEQKQVVRDTIAHINETLVPTKFKMELLKDGDENAEITIYYDNLDALPDLARRLKCGFVQGNWGYASVSWNGKHEITRGTVLLASDKLRGDLLKHFALEEITHTLGLLNDSEEYPESTFYSKFSLNPMAIKHSPYDRVLIQLFYQHIQPGDEQAEVRKVLDEFWPKDVQREKFTETRDPRGGAGGK